MKLRILLSVLSLSAGLSLPLAAQTAGAGTITGVVTDPSGAAVPGATVVVKNTAMQTERTITSNEAGIYVAQFVQPGAYEVTISKAGFGKLVRTGVTVQVGQTLTVNVPLTVESATQAVTVEGNGGIVDTEKTEMSQVITQTQKEN